MTALFGWMRRFWVAPVVFGALLYLAFPNSLIPDQGWLAFPAWTALLLSLRLRKGDRAFKQGFAAAFLFFLPALTWIAPLVVGGWLFTAAYCAVWEGLYCWLLARFWLRDGRAGWVVPAAALHLLIDVLRTVFMTGFPWFITGYTGWQNPALIGSADLLGVHGSTLAIILVAAGLAEAIARKAEGADRVWRPVVPGVALLVAFAAWSGVRSIWIAAPRPGPIVALLQGNIPQLLKEDRDGGGGEPPTADEWWRLHSRLIDEAHRRAAAEGRAVDVVIWPETMVPAYANRDFADEATRDLFAGVADISRGAQTFAGVQTVEYDERGYRVRAWNSMVALSPDGAPRGVQDKQHLTPGGEYIPLLDLLPFRDWLRDALMEKAGFLPDLSPGEGVVLLPVDHAGGTARVGVLICYESLFPEISREMTQDGADILLNASNYGWFVGTPLMEQCLAMAAYRAAECGRPMVLTSNNGISAVVDARGRTTEIFEDDQGRQVDVPGVLVAEVPLASRGTPFLLWGEWAAWLLGLLALGSGWAGARRRT